MDPDTTPARFARISGSSFRRLLGDTTQVLADQATPAQAPQTPKEVTAALWNDLQGTWSGNHGVNVIALPAPTSTPDSTGSFTLVVNAYSELLTVVNPGAPARNRGGTVDQFVAALAYEQRVTDTSNSELLHVENGMFLNLSTIVDTGTTTARPVPEFNIARSGTIPHGDSIMLLGAPPVVTPGRPDISDESALPTNIGTTGVAAYEAPYRADHGGIDAADPGSELCRTLDAQAALGIEVLSTTTFTFDSDNHGAVVNVPYVVAHANTTRMTATFWLEKMRDGRSGQEFDQLQYRQTILLAFHHAPANPADDLILWPHVTVNTLVKQ
jgi:hypothetical protein